ncbi:hypothetical protein SAMN05192562_1011, partial [Kosakonia arachidis]
AVMAFLDYQFVFCRKMAPEIEAVMSAGSNVHHLFKEWPIFGDRR